MNNHIPHLQHVLMDQPQFWVLINVQSSRLKRPLQQLQPLQLHTIVEMEFYHRREKLIAQVQLLLRMTAEME